MEKENRKYKDTVFCDLFYKEPDARKNLLELYNALNGTSYTDPEIVQLVRLEDTLYMNFKNDVAFTVKEQKIILSEHQSTINPNMPLRDLLYIGREYEKIIDTNSQFKKILIKIPKPVFYTFYNGEEDYPQETELHLSDAFRVPGDPEEPSMELTVKVININIDKKHKILEKCEKLKEYSQFVELTRRHKENEESLKTAIKACIQQGILAEYLKRKGTEVLNMLMDEYSYETDIAVQRQEAMELGEKIGEERVIIKQIIKKLKKSLTVSEIADQLEEPEERVARIVKIAEKYAPDYDEQKILEEL